MRHKFTNFLKYELHFMFVDFIGYIINEIRNSGKKKSKCTRSLRIQVKFLKTKSEYEIQKKIAFRFVT